MLQRLVELCRFNAHTDSDSKHSNKDSSYIKLLQPEGALVVWFLWQAGSSIPGPPTIHGKTFGQNVQLLQNFGSLPFKLWMLLMHQSELGHEISETQFSKISFGGCHSILFSKWSLKAPGFGSCCTRCPNDVSFHAGTPAAWEKNVERWTFCGEFSCQARLG